jgi:C4-dicarboxylate-specific signal transduction histidine kinase
MEADPEHTAEEIKRLRRCMNDLIGILALPAVWSGGDASQIVGTLLDALSSMLRLDFIYVRLKDSAHEAPVETVRVAQWQRLSARPQEMGDLLNNLLGPDSLNWAPLVRTFVGDTELSIVPLQLGLQGDIGVIVAASQRMDFPGQPERLILSIAANQAVIGLQEARLLNEQKQAANVLDRRVAQRTKELAAANEELTEEIAERKRAEEELRRSETFLAEGQRLSLTGSFCWRVATDEIAWSQQLYRIFAFDQGVPVTLDLIRTRIHPEDISLMNGLIDRVRAAGGDFEVELRLQMPDRSIKHLHLIARMTRDATGRLEYIGAAQDVTQRRLSEEALAQARSELAHVARVTSLGVLSASIAHEVNQPLASILMNCESSLRWLARPEPNVDKVKELTGRVVADARRASQIIDRVRTMAARRAPEQTPLSLNDLVEDSIIFLSHELRSKSTSVSLNLAPALPRVVGDRTQLQQVLVNLATNAAQALVQSGTAHRNISIQTSLLSDPGMVCCIVEDSGPGIDPTHLPRLFDTFFTTKDAGMGMGLSISKSIIEAHGGRIVADNNSTLGGARFQVVLPCDV